MLGKSRGVAATAYVPTGTKTYRDRLRIGSLMQSLENLWNALYWMADGTSSSLLHWLRDCRIPPTHFHFDNIGEMTFTPKDFSAITDVQVFGRPLEYDMEAHNKCKELLQFFGKWLVDIAEPTMTYTYIYREHSSWVPKSAEDVDRLASVFILCLIGSTMWAGRTNSFIHVLPKKHRWNWNI